MASNQRTLYDSNFAVAFLWPFKVAIGLTVTYVMLGAGAIAIALLFAKYQWWEDPIQASDTLFYQESSRVKTLSESTGSQARLALVANASMQSAYWLFFKAPTLHEATQAHFAGARVNKVDKMYFEQFVARNAREIYISMNVIQVYGIKMGFLISAAPLFFLLYLVAGIDGFTERYIRRACAGRESSDMNKLGKLSKLMLLASLSMIYLCMPVSLDPIWIIVPLAVVFAVGTRIQWKFYKKYL